LCELETVLDARGIDPPDETAREAKLMNQLQYNNGAFRSARARNTQTPQQRVFGIIFAATVEVAIIYALLLNMGVVKAPRAPTVTTATLIPDDKEIEKPPVPPTPIIETPPIVQTIAPVIDLQYVPSQPNVITIPTRPPVIPPIVERLEPPPVITYSPAQAIIATHTTPDYPPLARRLGQQGTLRLKLVVNEQGSVSDAVVVNSSGFPYLDSAAVEWVKQHWRYEPAKQGTRAVRAEVPAVVTFKLQ
jgi:protein TonB